jgi:serine/threonine protein phosphatase PrpC
MGGGKKGEVAARLAAEAFREVAGRLRHIREPEMADRMIRAAFQQANNRVLPLRTECGAYGTTVTVVCTNGSVFKIYSLGDSRGYLLRNRDLFQLTRDHTLAQMKIEAGTYKQDDPQVKKDRNRLTEYIGRDSTGEGIGPEETQWLPLTAGDSILLCSDGLYDMCGNGEIGAGDMFLRLYKNDKNYGREDMWAEVMLYDVNGLGMDFYITEATPNTLAWVQAELAEYLDKIGQNKPVTDEDIIAGVQ